MKKSRYLTAKEAAEILGISPATLYAYVSRGLVRSETISNSSRERRYHAEDIQKLKERQQQRKNPVVVVQSALHWGAPLLESELTLIMDGNLYYRGQDVLELAREQRIEQVAALLWTGRPEAANELFDLHTSDGTYLEILRRLDTGLSVTQKLQVALALASKDDLAAYDLRPDMVARTGARIFRLAASIIADRAVSTSGIAELLASGWGVENAQGIHLLNAALILCVDHELNVSSFTARVVASAETQPYGVVIAGLSALQGFKHGGNTERVETLLNEIAEPSQAPRVIGERLRRGERIPGFGHKLYPEGDPRAVFLLRLLTDTFPDAPALALGYATITTVLETIEQYPNIDFALATLTRALSLPAGSPLSIFALGRTVGWIGHAIEQYKNGDIIRPRATYIGIPPQPDTDEHNG